MNEEPTSSTLRRDISSRDDILKYLLQLSEVVGRRARQYGVAGKTVSLYVRFADYFLDFGKQDTVSSYINQSDRIYRAAIRRLDTAEINQSVRLLGVKLSNLQYHYQQLPLFLDERRKALMVQTMDAVNNKHGDYSVTFASLLATEEKGRHVISPAWRPD